MSKRREQQLIQKCFNLVICLLTITVKNSVCTTDNHYFYGDDMAVTTTTTTTNFPTYTINYLDLSEDYKYGPTTSYPSENELTVLPGFDKDNYKFQSSRHSNEIVINSITNNGNIVVKDLKYGRNGKIDHLKHIIRTNDVYRITNLEPCTAYLISADVTVKQTTIEWTFTHQEIINTAYETPKTDLNPEIPFYNSIYLSWNSSHQTCIKTYESIVENEDQKFAETNNSTHRIITNLEPCTNYMVSIFTIDIYDNITIENMKMVKTSYIDPGPISEINVTRTPDTFDYMVTWNPPESSGSCVDYYTMKLLETVFYRDRAKREQSTYFKINAEQMFKELKNLESCTQYQISIHPNDLYLNDTQFTIFDTPTIEIGPVEDLRNDTYYPSNVTLAWDPPVNGTNCVQSYLVEFDGNVLGTTNETFYFIDDLMPCNVYMAKVCVIDLNDTMGECVEIEINMAVDTPSIVLNIRKEESPPSSPRTAIIRWDPPTYGELCIENYRTSVWIENHNNNVVDSIVNDTMVELNNLEACIEHTIQIIPITLDDTMNGPSDQFRFDSPPKLPNIPLAPAIDSKTSTTLDLYAGFNPYKNLCSNILGKFTCINADDHNDTTIYETIVQIIEPLVFFYGTVENLTPFTSYSCTARIQNEAGWSERSGVATYKTLEDYPDVPEEIASSLISTRSFKITWTPPQYPNGILKNYHINIHSLGTQYTTPDSCEIPPIIPENTTYIVSADTEFYLYINAEPFTLYTIQIAAENSAGLGMYSEPLEITTNPDKPGPVRNFKITEITGPKFKSSFYNASVVLEWLTPCRPNGIVINFVGTIFGIRTNQQVHSFTWNLPSSLNEFNETKEAYVHTIPNLKPEYNYTIKIMVKVASVQTLSDAEEVEFESPGGIPDTINIESWGNATVIEAPNPTENAIVELSEALFSPEMGDIRYIALLISQRECQNDPIPTYDFINTSYEWPEVFGWSDVHNLDCIQQYQTTNARWNPFSDKSNTNGTTTMQYVIGEDENCDGKQPFCNGPLKPGTKYALIARAFTRAGYADSKLIYFETDTKIQTLIIIVTVSSILVLSFVLGFIYYLTSKKQKRIEESLAIAAGDSASTGIPIKTYTDYYSSLKFTHFEKEYNSLNESSKQLEKTMTTEAAKANHMSKNRYTNIFPYDYNRVLLETKDVHDMDSTDYINASFIHGYKKRKEYIAAQGPKPETCNDFWNMIIQYNCDKIVMLTQIFENDKIKCHKYYPNYQEEMKFDNIVVINVKEIDYENYLRREFKVMKPNFSKLVYQYHFKKWPDHDCPQEPLDLIKFIEVIKTERRTASPILMHCSAGVGRTGTLIALDILMQKIKDEKIVNIYETVLKLRQQRVKMVQTQDQYRFLYKCVNEVMNRKNSKRFRKGSKLSVISEASESQTSMSPHIRSNPIQPIDPETTM